MWPACLIDVVGQAIDPSRILFTKIIVDLIFSFSKFGDFLFDSVHTDRSPPRPDSPDNYRVQNLSKLIKLDNN